MKRGISTVEVVTGLVFTLFVLVTSVTLADEKDKLLENLISRAKKERQQQIDNLTAEIKTITTSRKKIVNRQQLLKSHKASLAELKKSKSLPIPKIDEELKVGSVGAPREPKARIVQIIDGNNAIAKFETVVEHLINLGSGPIERNSPTMKRYETVDFDFLLRDVPTGGLADGIEITMPACISVTGNYQYQTVAGANRTLLIIEPFDASVLSK